MKRCGFLRRRFGRTPTASKFSLEKFFFKRCVAEFASWTTASMCPTLWTQPSTTASVTKRRSGEFSSTKTSWWIKLLDQFLWMQRIRNYNWTCHRSHRTWSNHTQPVISAVITNHPLRWQVISVCGNQIGPQKPHLELRPPEFLNILNCFQLRRTLSGTTVLTVWTWPCRAERQRACPKPFRNVKRRRARSVLRWGPVCWKIDIVKHFNSKEGL